MAGNAKPLFQEAVRIHVRVDRRIRNILDQTGAKDRSRYAERNVPQLLHLRKIRLRHAAIRRIAAACDRKKVMDAAIWRVRLRPSWRKDEWKTHFANRSIHGKKGWNFVFGAVVGSHI